jgi:glycosyltransferase involved in cell wall biosynthesis
VNRLKVLVLSDFFPMPPRADGIFVERQAYHLKPWCDQAVVVAVRVFPHLRIWKQVYRPARFLQEWKKWKDRIVEMPSTGDVNGLPVFYVRYTSPPKQIFQSVWGFFAYPFLKRTLVALHKEHHFDLIHAHWTVPSGVVAVLAQRWMKVPIVLTVHGSEVTYVARKTLFGTAVVRWVLRKVSKVLANSTWTARELSKYGADPERLSVIWLGGNRPKELQRMSEGHKSEVVQLLTVGYLAKRKGHRFVIEALRVLRDRGYVFEYTIVGDGPEERLLRGLVDDLGLGDVVYFVGHKPHAEVWPYFLKCDIFVLPSWAEAFGVVYTEALGLGKPIIACEGEGGPEDLKALGPCVELVKPRDVQSLVQAIGDLIDDPAKREDMGRTGREIVSRYFTWERNAVATMEIYRDLVNAQTTHILKRAGTMP